MKATKCRTMTTINRKPKLRVKRLIGTITVLAVSILLTALRFTNVTAENRLVREKEKTERIFITDTNQLDLSAETECTGDTESLVMWIDDSNDVKSNNAENVINLYTSDEISESEKNSMFEFYSSEICKDFSKYYSTRLNRYVSPFELYHLTRITYSEAGTQGMEGKIAVAATILNRMEDTSGLFENRIYDVIFQHYQFSSADILDDERKTAGKYFSYGGEQVYEDLDPSIKADCLEAAKQALDGVDPTREATGGGALFFFNPEYCSEDQMALRANIPYDNIIIIEEHWFHREWPAA